MIIIHSIGMKIMFYCVQLCPYGCFGDTQKACTCAPAVVTKYQKRISGSLLDSIDIHIEVPRVDYEKLSGDHWVAELSKAIRTVSPTKCLADNVNVWQWRGHWH